MKRLTDAQRRDRAMTGAQLQEAITKTATILGYQWLHIRPGLRANGRWYVPVEGPLGAGWPDLVLVRPRDRRLIFAELKRELGDPLTPEQTAVLETLMELAYGRRKVIWPDQDVPRISVAVWRPSDLGDPIESGVIYAALR